MTESDLKAVTVTWAPVPGAANVLVADRGGLVRILAHTGRNRRHYPEKLTRGTKSGRSRYWQVSYTDDRGEPQKRPVHTLILEAHVGLRPVGREGCHGDGDLDNNNLSNLRWDWPDANREDRFGVPCPECGGTGRLPVTDSDPRLVAASDGHAGDSSDGA